MGGRIAAWKCPPAVSDNASAIPEGGDDPERACSTLPPWGITPDGADGGVSPRDRRRDWDYIEADLTFADLQ